MTTPCSIALILPGEAMWGAFQTGFVLELARQLAADGRDCPIDLAIGSSSGSLVATAAAANPDVTHDAACQAWIDFGTQTSRLREIGRRLATRRLGSLYSDALAQIFAGELMDTRRAFASPTTILVAATRFDREKFAATRTASQSILRQGLEHLWLGHGRVDPETLAREVAAAFELGAEVFTPCYFTNHDWPDRTHDRLPAKWVVVKSPDELLTAVKASSRIPGLYGPPIEIGGEIFIDGVYGDNAPIELALQFGAKHIFIVTSSRGGHVFERPIQSMTLREVGRGLKHMQGAGRLLARLPVGRQLGRALQEVGELSELLPNTRPIDLAPLREGYPDQTIHIVHPPRNAPRIRRFTESRPRPLSSIYALGVEAGRQAAALV